MNKNVYILSGLGADERVFQHLEFTNHNISFIKWIPLFEDEKIENYAKRIIEQQITSPRPIIVGLSFGGIMAIEISKLIVTEKVIIISSAKTKSEIPFYYRIFGILQLHKFIPTRLLIKSNIVTNWLFGTTSNFDKAILKDILQDTDEHFLRWSIDKIVKWSNQTKIDNLIHIHGTGDRILPISFLSCDIKINSGGHLMTLNKSQEINKVLKQKLDED